MDHENNRPMMRTIKETAVITGLPVHAIRVMVKNNKIVYVNCGKKVLINVGKLFEYLETGEIGSKCIAKKCERNE